MHSKLAVVNRCRTDCSWTSPRIRNVRKIEVNSRLNPAVDSGFKQPSNTEGYAGRDSGKQGDFRSVLACPLNTMIINVEAIEDPVDLGRIEIVILGPVADPRRIKAEAEIRCS